MNKKRNIPAILCLLLMSACGSHYSLSGVERTRIVIDSRFDLNPDQALAEYMAPFKRVNDSIMGPIVGKVAHNMHGDRPESDLSNLLADILVWASKDYGEQPVLGVYNMGGIRADLTRGDVTYGDVLDVAPFENKICFVTLTGVQLMELFREIAGTGGEGVSRGTELVISKDFQLISARLHGKEIDPTANYRVATINYLLEGNDKMMVFREGTNKVAPDDVSNNTRFLIMNYFREKSSQNQVVDAKIEGRIRVQ